ncbi:type II secretion system inner membrane protein GspF [Aliivibrio sp. S4TY2]|uniref:type II secretion system inner membrane protein GspF n=1 Tax=unclassified Aliivibrio TaxID=2645654 RepID=UPI002377D6DF|nr:MULTISPECIES: type II secretion system inner membrane protein GspF [unclassified Aliivibrio]MDD9157762.1 type II secretion system inner membrane protein GspF [Aliivibrio sp. S4TY2]MDD9161733.1 type II secretion system inner membrane protein GspF [Aliivibrio sp. S4TY1]MDD9165763.1 type II secretion system inner membrane protein GspF [Aliivibrio sp. S4MY2]MDD9169762.1 type II secretion system inner membrane protein GspF [Aliivibrio sp. S4MY4]MDD9186758.1 type II secretion system inner membran
MAAFEYKALEKTGKQKKGVMEGDNGRQVRQRLKEQGLIPVEVIETKSKQQKSASQGLSFKRGISVNDLSLITRQLATLVQAGMPLEECLKAVAEQGEKAHIRSMMMGVRSRVIEGYPLAESFADYPHVFDELFCSMVAAGEKSGHLDTVLNRLADYAENRQKMRSKLQQAMIYPIMLTLIAIAVIAFLLATVVPKIVDQFVQMGQGLPTVTEVLLAASNFVVNWGLVVVIVVVSLIVGVKWLLTKPHLRLAWDKKILRLPVVGKVVRGLNTSRFARTLSICTSSAIPLLDGMKVAADVMSNQYFKQQVLEAADNVREGASLRISLEQTKLFPPMMLHMIASGEQSGELEQMLTRSADNQDRDFESLVNMALGIFEPLLIVFMAGIVLFIVVATLMPIIELNNLVG